MTIERTLQVADKIKLSLDALNEALDMIPIEPNHHEQKEYFCKLTDIYLALSSKYRELFSITPDEGRREEIARDEANMKGFLNLKQIRL